MTWGFPILLATGLAIGWAMLVLFTVHVLTHPPRRGYAYAVSRNVPGDPSELVVVDADGQTQRGLPYERWTFRSRGVDLPVWDVRGLDANGPTIIITHGWGDSRVVMLSRLAHLASLASRIVMWDLPGHGDAPGGFRGFTLGQRESDDLISLVDRLEPPGRGGSSANPVASRPGPVVLFGASLGAGASIAAAAALAARDGPGVRVRGVIAEAPYRLPDVPARNVFRIRAMPYRTNILPAMALLGLRFGRGLSWAISPTAGGFDRAEHARRLPATIPLLVLHGSVDPVCPLEDGRAIAAAATSGRCVVIAGGGHNNLWTEAEFAPVCTAAVRALLEEPANVSAHNGSTSSPAIAETR